MFTTQQILERGKNVLIGNYGRLPIVMARGEGSSVWDTDGRKYIDLFAGFGAAILGHCHPSLVAAATGQIDKLWHVGNTFYTEPQIEFAERLNASAFPGKAFFCHSGLEANEAAVKLARLRGQQSTPRKWKTISLNRSFHGRSMALIAATGNPATKAGFEPMVPGFLQVEAGDFGALESAVDAETAAIMVEPIQGEGGIYPLTLEYAQQLRQLCDARGITLIFDEVWTGGGRTGKWFGYQHFVSPGATSTGDCVTPDIMTLGKAVGGGLPVGVMYARPDIAALLVPGKHGCTLGGNPICMSVAREIFDVIQAQGLLEHARKLGEMGMATIKANRRLTDRIVEIRGKGLFLGIELKSDPTELVEKALANGVIVNLTAKRIIRLAPALNISEETWKHGLAVLMNTIEQL